MRSARARGRTLRVIGYEDVKSRFYGLGRGRRARQPARLAIRRAIRSDEGLLFGFEPCASLRAELEIPPGGAAEIIIVDGWARDIGAATRRRSPSISDARPSISPRWRRRCRASAARCFMPAPPQDHRYRFAEDGRSLTLDARHAAALSRM